MKTQKEKSTIIIGAGLAGLAMAIRMRNKGYKTTVFEKNEIPGGKIQRFSEQGYHFDIGPSVITMPEYIQDLFRMCGKNPDDYIQFKQLNPVFNYFFDDGKQLTAYSDPIKTAEIWSKDLNEDINNIKGFLDAVKEKYRLTEKVFLKSSLHKVKTYLNWEALRGTLLFHRVKAFKSMSKSNAQHFKSPYLQKIFNSFASYNGSDPFQAPATFNVIAHYEMNLGTYYPVGGIDQIAKALYKLANEIGVQFEFGADIRHILTEGNIAKGIEANEKEYLSDLVISCMDVNATYETFLDEKYHVPLYLNREKSNAPLLLLWGMKKKFPQLGVHNMILAEDQKAEYNAVFNKNIMPEEPGMYLHIGSKLESSDAPEGQENWFIYLNAPKDNGQDWDELAKIARQKVIESLSKQLGENIEPYIDYEKHISPADFAKRDSNPFGSIYGNSSNGIFSAFLRHPNFAPKVTNLYFAGGTVHPGSGVPLTLLSTEIVEGLID